MATDGTVNAGGGAADESQPKPVRTMDDIARLFMSGARDNAASQRRGPQASQGNEETLQVPVPGNAPRVLPGAPMRPELSPLAAQVMITALTADAGWHSAISAARHLAAEWDMGVGIIGNYRGKMQILRAGAPRHGATAIAGLVKEGDLDLQIARALIGVQENVACWLVVLPLGRSADFVLSAVRDWMLVSGTDNESVVAAYRVLKNVASADPLDEPRQVRLFLSCDDYAQAAVVHTRLRRAAREFLQMELPLVGVNCGSPAEVQTLAEFDVGVDDSGAWGSISEFLHDLLGSSAESDGDVSPAEAFSPPPATSPVAQEPAPALEPEKAMPPLGEQWNRQWQPETVLEEETPVPITPELPTEPVTFEAPAKALKEFAAAPVEGMLRAVEVATITTDSRWQSVIACAGELCAGQQIEARPPYFDRAAIFLDNAGVLHAWILSDASAGADFLRLWQWARDHRQILALTKRDRWVDVNADIRLHVVTPAESKVLPATIPNLSNYRLTLMKLGDKTVAAVIPA